MELINKFDSEELARVFTWKYKDFYKVGGVEEKEEYRDIIVRAILSKKREEEENKENINVIYNEIKKVLSE